MSAAEAAAVRRILGRRSPHVPSQGQPLDRSPSATGCPAGLLVASAGGEQGVVLARRLGGELALPVAAGFAVLSLDRLRRHMLVCGATGSGKTETLLRVAWSIAKTTGAQVFYLDGKGDRETAERFCGLMADAGRQARVFPHEPFDAWRGRSHEVHGKLMQVVDYASDGPASWYRDLAKTVLRLVCEHPDGPPRSSSALLARLDPDHLAQAHPASGTLAALKADQVRQVRLRYEAFFGQTRGALDGQWSWEDTTTGYLLLDALALKEETKGLARLIFEDFALYFALRKPRERFCVLIVDEFSALAEGAGMAARVEQARGFNTALVLAPQVTAGMGDRIEAERIMGSAQTIVCHRVNTPEPVVSLAGTKKAPEHSMHYAADGPSGEGSLRIQHQFKIDPNKVRALPAGSAFIISNGRAMRAQILQAPPAHKRLPSPLAASPSGAGEPNPCAVPTTAGIPAGATEAGAPSGPRLLDTLRF